MSPSSIDTALSGDMQASAAASPSTAVSSPAHSDGPPRGLDDIFGSSPTHTPGASPSDAAPAPGSLAEPSDVPSLRRQHVTAGYRDGIAVAKTDHVQRGFDTGFPIGAQLGVRAGVVLGVLEGLVNCAPQEKIMAGDDAAIEGLSDVRGLYERARKELTVRGVFGGAVEEADVGKQGEEPHTVVEKAGEAVVSKWEGVILGLVEKAS
ncbi:Essential protein Yae1, N terminal [Ophidiomyces ophidiicola]|uniref:Essential protein Yae1, N terminal n=1 Tax=Ophidiomyces ophidiicola TaxID=1387563 RepID=A0ACB8UMY1_9EURO|nr:Essential protein Yae1, N terminal [Ophidiomyces ophidiicola]KAI1909317.1 Essential protein Yae1, N terminal [Ophidiomyces ophidiicola]KAI1919693.1 Essential protein Yae1, N terminal [Ophidiomyces ophidiicola]KAI1999960.1 Essential protein Yae1, N terminal [Ophidiomyces ophidiicola]KAI2016717.1 Essential protein Yae1, N terminal [Ophidiomyces ophidiicola]